jgi:hypothetical protein
VCAPSSSDGPVFVGAAQVSNRGPVAVRVESVALTGSTGLDLVDDFWAKKVDPAGDSAIGASPTAPELSGYTRVGADGLVVGEGEQWSLVVGVVAPPAGGRADGFEARWTAGPFEFTGPAGPTVTLVPSDAPCS